MSAKKRKLEQIQEQSQSVIIRKISESSKFTTTEKLVLIQLYKLRLGLNMFWHTAENIAKRAGCSTRHVYRIYNKFKAMGLLRRKKYWLGIHHSVSKKHVVLSKIYKILGLVYKCQSVPSGQLGEATFGGIPPLERNNSAQNIPEFFLDDSLGIEDLFKIPI